jgi:hypothetical protein
MPTVNNDGSIPLATMWAKKKKKHPGYSFPAIVPLPNQTTARKQKSWIFIYAQNQI